MPTTTTPPSLIGLSTVSAEIQFIADFVGDLEGQTASKADKDRIIALLATAQADLAIAVNKVLVSLGQNPGIGDQG